MPSASSFSITLARRSRNDGCNLAGSTSRAVGVGAAAGAGAGSARGAIVTDRGAPRERAGRVDLRWVRFAGFFALAGFFVAIVMDRGLLRERAGRADLRWVGFAEILALAGFFVAIAILLVLTDPNRHAPSNFARGSGRHGYRLTPSGSGVPFRNPSLVVCSPAGRRRPCPRSCLHNARPAQAWRRYDFGL